MAYMKDSTGRKLDTFEVAPARAFGERLRRLAVTARATDPFTRPSLVAPPNWAASTAYTLGRVVKNGTGYYICVGAGTSAASGGPTITTGQTATDGTAIWTYYGPATVGPTDPGAPAYSSGTTQPSGLTNLYRPATTARPDAFKVYGAAREDAGTSVFLDRIHSKSGTWVRGDARVGFWTDSPKFAIMIAAAAIARVRIDGRLYSPDTIDNITSGTGYHTFDFTASGGRRPRYIEVDVHRQTLSFGGVAVAAADQVWRPDDLDDVTAAFVSDSIFAGSSYGPFAHSVPQILGAALGWSDTWNCSIGGTGYIETNPGGGGPFYVYGERVTEIQTLANPQIWVFAGSVNDKNSTTAAIKTAAKAAWAAVRAVSAAPIVVAGVWSVPTGGTLTALDIETALKDAVTEFADPLTFFIPVAGDTNGPWVSHSTNNTAFVTSNNIAQVVANDQLHPPDAGTRYFAYRLAAGIRRIVLPGLR